MCGIGRVCYDMWVQVICKDKRVYGVSWRRAGWELSPWREVEWCGRGVAWQCVARWDRGGGPAGGMRYSEVG